MGDTVHGSQYKQTGSRSEMTVHNSAGTTSADVDAAITELRAFIEHLTRTGAVGPEGQVNDPAAVVAEVETNRSRLSALGKAVLGGAKDAVLAAVQDGVGLLIVALLGRG